MELKDALFILIQDHLEEQLNDPQMLTLAETIALLGNGRGANLHEGMGPEEATYEIIGELQDMGMLEQAQKYFEKLDETVLREEMSLYSIMVDLGAVDWH
jgi:hypothetical protein